MSEPFEDSRRRVRIVARTLKAAKNIARQNKNLKISSGNKVESEPEEHGMSTYSFRVKDI